MATYKELLQERETLNQQIAEARQREIAGAVDQVRELIAEFSLSREVVFSTRSAPKGPVAAKYQDKESGATWTGRGKPPRWIAGKNRDDFLIAA